MRAWAFGVVLLAATAAAQDDKPRLVVQRGHVWPVGAAAISPDGRLVATAPHGRTAETCVWHVSTGRLLARLEGGAPLVFSPDGQRIATQIGQGRIRVYDIAMAEPVVAVDQKYEALSVAFSPDGRLLATAGGKAAKHVFVWEVATGREVQRLSGGAPVAFGPKGKLLATGERFLHFAEQDRSPILLWNVETGEQEGKLAGHSGRRGQAVAWTAGPEALAISPDGGRLLSVGRSDGVFAVWDLASGKPVTRFREHLPARGEKLPLFSCSAARIAISPVGEALTYAAVRDVARNARGKRSETLLWDVATGEVRRRLSGALAVAFTPDGPRAVTAKGNAARLWDVATGREIAHFPGAKTEAPSLLFASGGRNHRWLLIRGSKWDLSRGHRSSYHARDVGRIWAGPAQASEGLRELARRSKFKKRGVVVWSPDSRRAVTRGEGKTLRLWNVEDDRVVGVLAGARASFSPDGRFLVAGPGADGAYRLHDAATGKEQRVLGRQPMLAFSPDGRLAATTAPGIAVSVFDLETGEEKHRLRGHMARVVSVAFSATGTRVLTGSGDGTARVWSLATGDELQRVVGGGSVAFYPDGRYFATSARDGLVRLFETESGRLLCACVGFGEKGWAVVDPEGRYDASNGGDVDGLHWVVANEPLALDQLKERYYDPGLLAKHLGFHKEPLRVVRAFAAPKLYPAVRLEPPAGDDAVLKIHLANRGGGIGRVAVRINGKELTADARGARPDSTAEELSLAVPLAGDPRLRPGEQNVVEVEAYNAEGYLRSRGMRLTFKARGAATAPVHLWAVVAGVSDYRGEALDLRFAAKDAADFARALKTAAEGLFGAERVHVTHLEHPTRAELVRALKAARKAGPRDVLVLYLAGHGVSRDDFYFLARDARSADLSDPAVRRQAALASAELTELVKAIPATKQVLILDTCASGKFIEKLTEKREVPSDQIRALERLKDRTGLHVLAGCAADRVSYETSRYAQGLLTYSLLLGMRGAALKNDEYVDVSRLFSFAADRVPELAGAIGGIQRPVIAAPRGGTSFDIGKLDAEAKTQVPLRTVKPLVLRSHFQEEDELEDVLDLGKQVNTRLRAVESLVYVDATELPGAHRVLGRYRIRGGKVTVDVRLSRGRKKVARFDFKGRKKELAAAIVAEISRRLAGRVVRLDVPIVKQELRGMCGPASLEMLFRYWGETRHDQYAIARAILRQFPDVSRVKKSGILDDETIDWKKYPGTGTKTLRRFLEAFAEVENKRIEKLPADPKEAARVRDEFFGVLKAHVARGVPVLVHQYYKGPGTNGHYRVVTGYDETDRRVFLADPSGGRIEQDYATFIEWWNVARPWLPYNSIAFNLQRQRPLRVELK